MAGTNGNLRAEEVQMDHANLWLSQINPEWLEQAKAGLNAAYPGYCGASEEIQTKLLLDHFIFTDAPRCLRGSLPDIAGQNVLQGDYFVQIEEAFDASKPFKERYVDGHNPGRVLKLHLSDGKRSVIALEHNFIPDLSNKLSRGAKAILEGPIKVERGALLLVPGNISVIGGEVYELNAQMQALSQAVMQQPVGRRGPSPTLQQYMENQVHTLVQATGAAAVVGANGGAGGVLEGGRPVQPVSPELQQQQQAPHQRMPDSPRQLQQQQAPPPPAGNANASGVFMPSHQHQQFIPAIQQQQHGSISFGSGNVPPVGGSQQQQPGPVLIPPAANGNHPRPFPPLPLPPATVAERASSGEGWSSDSDDEEDEDDYGNDQPGAAGAAAAPAGQLQQQPPQEVIEILEEEDDDETQPFQEEEEEDNHEQLLNGLPQPSNNNTMVNRTRVVDSPGHETPIIRLGNTTNRDDIESSSQEDGHRELSIPWNSNSSGKKNKRKSETGLNSGDLRRRSTSPQITAQGMGNIPPTEPQEAPFQEVHAAAVAVVAAVSGGTGEGAANIRSCEKMKKQRLYSAGKSNLTTDIVLNAINIGAIGAAEAPPRAKAALIGDFDQVSNPLPYHFNHSPCLQLPAAVKVQQVSSLLMAHPPDLDQIKAGHAFEFPLFDSPLSPLTTAGGAVAAELPRQQDHQHPHQQQEQQQHEMRVNGSLCIQEWGSQGPQPFTCLYHLANYISAVDAAQQQTHPENLEISTAYPISATVQGSIVRIINKGVAKDPVTNAQRLVIRVLVEDATGSVEAVLSEALLLDLINGILRDQPMERSTMNTTGAGNTSGNSTHGNGTAVGGGTMIPQASSVDEVFRLKKHYPKLVSDALNGLKTLLQEHYGLIELMIHGAGEYPQIVQLLDLSLTRSQIDMLRARVQGGGANNNKNINKSNRYTKYL